MDMRLRLPELLDEHDLSAYELARRSAGRIIPATLYRLVKQQGRVRLIDGELVETIMDVLGVKLTDVLEAKPRGHETPATGAARKRTTSERSTRKAAHARR